MTFYTGTHGDDNFVGTSAADIFDMSQGGVDSVSGAENNDTFRFGSKLTHRDIIIGGDGADTVEVDGDYSAGLIFDPGMVTEIETFRMLGGHDYSITFDDTNFIGDATIDGSDLNASHVLTADASAETDTDLFIIGGAGDDVLIGGQSNNDFRLDLGGADTVTGGGTADGFNFGGAFDPLDVVDGAGGDDNIQLAGDYSAGLTLFAPMITSVEQILLTGTFDYVLTADRDLLDNGEVAYINGSGMAAANHVEFDGSALRKGSFKLGGSAGDDIMTGSKHADTFIDSQGGADTLEGKQGDDTFNMFGSLDAADEIDGGTGQDTLVLHGDYPTLVTFGTHTIQNIETITFEIFGSYNFATADGNVDSGDTLLVDGSLLGFTQVLTFNGIAELDGFFDIRGGDAADTLTGGENADVLRGGEGSDRLVGFHGDDTLYGGNASDTFNGGQGLDTYVVATPMDSTGAGYDKTLSFDTNEDVFDLGVGVVAIDTKVTGGALSTATFNTDLEAAIDNAKLAAHDAVIFKPDSGDLAGKTFLIVDANGMAGYDAFDDYVFQLVNFKHLNALSTANFI